MSVLAWQEAVDLSCLANWMDGQGLESGAIEDARALTGGTQNILVRFRRGSREFVLRRPPLQARQDGNRTILRESRVLAALAGTPVPHAHLIAACDDPVVLGAPFYLMAPVDGFNASGTPLPGAYVADVRWRRQMGLAMVEALILLGEVDHEAVGLADFGKAHDFLQRQVPRWRSQLEGYSAYAEWPGLAALPGVAEVGTWLEARLPQHFKPGLMHGDFHLANVMFREDAPEVAAIIDWELATIGDPLLDLGWLVATWPDACGQGAGTIHISPCEGLAGTDELVALYQARSTRDLSAIDWYIVLAHYKLAILLEGSHARACAGKAPPELGQKHHASALRLLGSALQRISTTV